MEVYIPTVLHRVLKIGALMDKNYLNRKTIARSCIYQSVSSFTIPTVSLIERGSAL